MHRLLPRIPAAVTSAALFLALAPNSFASGNSLQVLAFRNPEAQPELRVRKVFSFTDELLVTEFGARTLRADSGFAAVRCDFYHPACPVQNFLNPSEDPQIALVQRSANPEFTIVRARYLKSAAELEAHYQKFPESPLLSNVYRDGPIPVFLAGTLSVAVKPGIAPQFDAWCATNGMIQLELRDAGAMRLKLGYSSGFANEFEAANSLVESGLVQWAKPELLRAAALH